MIYIVVDTTLFEGKTIEDCMRQIAKDTVDDTNGEHSPTPYMKEIRVMFSDDDEFYLEVTGALQDKLEKMCQEEQFEYDDNRANDNKPFTYM